MCNTRKCSWCLVVTWFSASHVSYMITYEVEFNKIFCNISLTKMCQDEALTQVSISSLGYFTIQYLNKRNKPSQILSSALCFLFFCAFSKKTEEKLFLISCLSPYLNLFFDVMFCLKLWSLLFPLISLAVVSDFVHYNVGIHL